MAFYYGTKLDAAGRRRLFGSINAGPTLYEAIMLGLQPATAAAQNGFDLRTRPGAQAVSSLCSCMALMVSLPSSPISHTLPVPDPWL